MDIRSKAKVWVEQASIKQRIRYFQYQFEEQRWKQYWYLLNLWWWHWSGCGQKGKEQDVFIDYTKKIVYNQHSIIEKLLQYDVVSFDIFDTLLFRRVKKPTDLFAIMEKEFKIAGFWEKRIEAERIARKEKEMQKKGSEIVIEHIYQILSQWNICDVSFLEKELEMEQKVCYANPVMLNLIERLLEKGKTVIAVSDMYLHTEQIKELLQKKGYNRIQKIYVSCEYGRSKSDGRLFPVVLQECGGEKTMIHIGDNFYSDVFQNRNIISGIHYIRKG